MSVQRADKESSCELKVSTTSYSSNRSLVYCKRKTEKKWRRRRTKRRNRLCALNEIRKYSSWERRASRPRFPSIVLGPDLIRGGFGIFPGGFGPLKATLNSSLDVNYIYIYIYFYLYSCRWSMYVHIYLSFPRHSVVLSFLAFDCFFRFLSLSLSHTHSHSIFFSHAQHLLKD